MNTQKNPVKIIADYPMLGLRLIKRLFVSKDERTPDADYVIGFIKSAADLGQGELIPYPIVCNKETRKRFNAFPSSQKNIPTMTIFNYRGGIHQISREFSVRIRFKILGFIPWTCSYNLIPKETGAWYWDKKEKTPPAPKFVQIMNVDWENNSFKSLKESVGLFNQAPHHTKGSVIIKSICSLTHALGRYEKGPYIVLWDGYCFSMYSLEGKHLFGISAASKYDDDGWD